jgi:ribosomal protein L11 methyltransferase
MAARPFDGVDIASYWKVRRSSFEPQEVVALDGVPLIRIEPGTSFGDGSHETTQLCLQGLGFLAQRGFKPATVLDFGAGSGILTIAAARLRAQVDAVEIDESALASVRRNARLNGVETLIEARTSLSEPAYRYDLILANVVAGVLLDFADRLCRRQSLEGHMLLSGLVSTDVPAIVSAYTPLLAPMRPATYERGEWRAILFSP